MVLLFLYNNINIKMSMSSIKKCENTFCEEYYKKVKKMTENIIKLMIEQTKNKNIKNKKEINLKINEMKDKLKSTNFKEDTIELCKNSFCNPKCKGTIFQNKKFPNELINKYEKQKDGKITLKYLKKLRKTLFKNKKTILKDNFYEKLSNVKKLKEKGAISGCAIMSLI